MPKILFQSCIKTISVLHKKEVESKLQLNYLDNSSKKEVCSLMLCILKITFLTSLVKSTNIRAILPVWPAITSSFFPCMQVTLIRLKIRF